EPWTVRVRRWMSRHRPRGDRIDDPRDQGQGGDFPGHVAARLDALRDDDVHPRGRRPAGRRHLGAEVRLDDPRTVRAVRTGARLNPAFRAIARPEQTLHAPSELNRPLSAVTIFG